MALYEGFIIFAIRKLFQDLTDKFFFIAKKIIETMSSSKFSNVEVSKENVSRPKRAKRKLYTNEISSPIDISGQVVSYYFSSLKSKTLYVLFNSEILLQFELHSGLNLLFCTPSLIKLALKVILLVLDMLSL